MPMLMPSHDCPSGRRLEIRSLLDRLSMSLARVGPMADSGLPTLFCSPEADSVIMVMMMITTIGMDGGDGTVVMVDR